MTDQLSDAPTVPDPVGASGGTDPRAAGAWTGWQRDTLVAGRYRLLRPLGSGGSAQVWAARDESLGRDVALKALSGTRAHGGHERERFVREARLLAVLHHPRITTVYDFTETVDEDGGGQPFLVTELLDGESLRERLRRGPLAPAQAFAVCGQVADALASAHGSGVVHRDVKPGNVMLTARGAVLLDFGISRREADTDLTGQVAIGTPACMAPEQWRGQTARPASDIYALGCLLYWCLSGHAPYRNTDIPSLGMAHLLADPPALPPTGARHAEINAIYQACVRKDPDERPSASEVAAVLAASATSTTTETADMAAVSTLVTHRFTGRTRFAAYAAAAGAVLAASIVLPLTQAGGSPVAPASKSTAIAAATHPSTAATRPATTSGTAGATSARPPAQTTVAAVAAVANTHPSPPAAPGSTKTHGHPGHGHGKHGGS